MNFHPSMAGIEAATSLQKTQTTSCAGKLLVDLEYGECKYSIGEDAEGRYLFCAAETQEGQSYCSEHRIIAFQYAPEPRRRSFKDADARLLLSRQATAHIYQLPSLPQVRRAAVSNRFVVAKEQPKKVVPIESVFVLPVQRPAPKPVVLPAASDFKQAFEEAEQNHPLPEPYKVIQKSRSKEAALARLQDPAPPEPLRPSVRRIQKTVCAFLDVSFDDLISHRRFAPITMARQIAMYLCKDMTLHSLPEIGRRFDGRDHTTVLHAIRKIGRIVEKDEDLRAVIDTLKEGILDLPIIGGKTKTHEGAR